jgi:hypothetical protein
MAYLFDKVGNVLLRCRNLEVSCGAVRLFRGLSVSEF